MEFKKRLEKVKLMIFDVDGILTDNTVFMGPDDVEYKQFYIADGLAFYMAKSVGLKIALISGRYSPATVSRAKELKVDELFQDQHNKDDIIKGLLAKYELNSDEISYMGDDLVDLKAMNVSGFRITVPSAPQLIKDKADYITTNEGGKGAVREFIDMVLESKDVDIKAMWEAKF
ncbi:MAG: HAD hydrolase family protein [candidate division Zixibacteria bacterium]|nr:HAD hydrolase family protein [candidate division Zixibacteria bacterium]